MKVINFSWLIWLIFILVIAALIATGWFYAQCDFREWANIFINLIITVIGAFLGFVTALWLDKISENEKTFDTKKKYTQSLSSDIKKMIDSLLSIIEKDANGEIKRSTDGKIIFQSLQNKYLYFELPVWDAIVSDGEVNLFNKEVFFDDICSLSAKIKSFNNLGNNVMVAKLINSKINVDPILEQKLEEIYNICIKIDTLLSEK